MQQHSPTSIFKAYDIRGRYPEEINELVVAEIVKTLARHWRTAKRPKGKQVFNGIIVIGHDARLSSPALYKAVLETRNSKSYILNPLPVGAITTPMLYFLVNYFNAAGGIMVTASHNPKEYNGLKVVGPNAEPIGGKDVAALLES